VSIVPEITREERLRQFVRQAQERAFSLSHHDVVDYLLGSMRGTGVLRLSELPVDDAIQALSLLRAVEAARDHDGLEVERLDAEPLDNAIMSGTDYAIRRRHIGHG
jgi:hypothetical protein